MSSTLQDRIRSLLIGSAVGYEAIPQFYKDDLDMHGLILHMADDLYRGEVTKMGK